MNIVSVTDFRNNISEYLNRIFYYKNTMFVRKGKKIIAEVKYYNEEKKAKESKTALMELAGLWKCLDVKKFKEDLKKIRKKDDERFNKLIKRLK